MMPVVLTFEAIMVELAAMKISMVFSFETVVIVFIINVVVIMAVPGGIRIVGVSRIGVFVDAYLHMYLGAGGIHRQGTHDDDSENH